MKRQKRIAYLPMTYDNPVTSCPVCGHACKMVSSDLYHVHLDNTAEMRKTCPKCKKVFYAYIYPEEKLKATITNPELRKDITITLTVGGSAPYHDRLNVDIEQKGNPNASHHYCLEMGAEEPPSPEKPHPIELTDTELATIARWANATNFEASLPDSEMELREKIVQSIEDYGLRKYSGNPANID